MRKHTTWTVVLAAALLVALNALALPKMLGAAYAMPEGEVVAQQSAAAGAREPLPAVPDVARGFTVEFNREMTPEEQAIWDASESAGQQLLDDVNSGKYRLFQFEIYEHIAGNKYAPVIQAPMTYSKAAMAQYEKATGLSAQDNLQPMRSERHSESANIRYDMLEVGIDIGSVTVFLPDNALTADQAAALRCLFQQNVFWNAYQDPTQSTIGQYYGELFPESQWIRPYDDGIYKMNRRLCAAEQRRATQVEVAYLYDGLRPTEPLLTEAPEHGEALWYDEDTATIHLPEAMQLNDDELLWLYQLQRTLTSRAVITGGDVQVSEPEAVAVADEMLLAWFGLQPEDHIVHCWLSDQDDLRTGGREPVWMVTYLTKYERPDLMKNPERTHQNGAQLGISALDGTLVSGMSLGDTRQHATPVDDEPSGSTTAVAIAERLAGEGTTLTAPEFVEKNPYLSSDPFPYDTRWKLTANGIEYAFRLLPDGTLFSVSLDASGFVRESLAGNYPR